MAERHNISLPLRAPEVDAGPEAAGSLRARLRAAARDESGAVIVLVAILLVVLLGMAALVIDLGGLYDRDRDLQTLADAGALAGVQELIYAEGDQGAAATKADEYVSANADVSNVVEANLAEWSPVVDATSVTVDLREDHVPFFFARVFGRTEGSVTAHAKAETKYLIGVESAFPVAFMYANPHHWRFVFKSGGTEVYRFDLYDASWDGIGAGDGEFEEVKDRWPATWTPGPGTYDVYLYAMDKDNNDAIGFTGPVGRFFVPAADSRLLRVGMERAGGGVTVYAQVNPDAPAVEAKFDTANKFTTMDQIGEG